MLTTPEYTVTVPHNFRNQGFLNNQDNISSVLGAVPVAFFFAALLFRVLILSIMGVFLLLIFVIIPTSVKSCNYEKNGCYIFPGQAVRKL